MCLLLQTRCLEAMLADKERSRFVLGTSSLQASNQVRYRS